MNTNVASTKVITNKVRFSFVNVHKPRRNERSDVEKYSVTILVPKSDEDCMNRIWDAEDAAARKKFPGKPDAFYERLATIIYDGDGFRPNGEAFGPECKGHWVFTASSVDAPGIVDENAAPLMEQIKSGDYGRVSINFYGYDTAGNRGVTAGLNNIQLLERGESLGGRTDAATDFGGANASASNSGGSVRRRGNSAAF